MNKKNVLAIALVAMTAWIGKPAMAAPGNDAFDPVEYAMPLMGTQSSFELSTGNTYPIPFRRWVRSPETLFPAFQPFIYRAE